MSRIRHAALIAGLILAAGFTGACATSARKPCTPMEAMGDVTVNGKVIHSTAHTLLELLRDDPQAGIRLRDRMEPAPPLVVVDGAALVDTRLLADIPLSAVVRVDRLRPADATARYGGKAGAGAIVIETRKGKETADTRPGPCPAGI